MFALGKDDRGVLQSRRKRAEAHCVFVRRCAHLMSRSIKASTKRKFIVGCSFAAPGRAAVGAPLIVCRDCYDLGEALLADCTWTVGK